MPSLFKIHERLLYDQMYTYFNNFFRQYQCGFRKGYSAQHCLLAMTEKMKEARDTNKVCVAVLTDLSKAFDCLLHDLPIAKLQKKTKKQKQNRNKQKTTKQTKTAITYNVPCLHHRWRCYQTIALNDQQIGPISLAFYCHHRLRNRQIYLPRRRIDSPVQHP